MGDDAKPRAGESPLEEPHFRGPDASVAADLQPVIEAIYTCGANRDLLLRFLCDLLSATEAQHLRARMKVAWQLLEGASVVALDGDGVASDKVISRVWRCTLGQMATGGFYTVGQLQRLIIPPEVQAIACHPPRRKPRASGAAPARRRKPRASGAAGADAAGADDTPLA